MPRAMKRAVTSAAEYGVARAGIAAAHALDHDVSGQNRQTTGAAGRVAAWEMTLRPSNRQRSAWVVSLLNVQPADQVLEIGFGPGLAIAALVRAGAGQVYGIDHSAVMLRQASRRNAAAIRAGRVTLLRASVDQLPPAVNGPFAAILAVNSLAFWPAPAQRLAELRHRLAPGGCVAIASQPRCAGATAETSRRAARRLEDLFRAAGYPRTRTKTLNLDPPVACVLAVDPDSALAPTFQTSVTPEWSPVASNWPFGLNATAQTLG